MADKRTQVTVAHASFWYIDEEGRNRVALRGDVIEVADDDHKRGTRFEAFVIDEGAEPDASGDEPDGPKPGTAEFILNEVGDDKGKAQAALDEEKAGKNRKTLVADLEKILAT